MSTVGPPPSMHLLPAAAAVAQSAIVTNLPAGLANLTAGTIVKGVVVGRDGKGHTLVRTANGTLTLTTALSLPTGSALSLQVQTVGTQMQMVVLSVTEQPGGQGAEQVAGSAAPAVEPAAGRGAPAQPGPPPPVTISTETVLTATVVRAAAPGLPGSAPGPAGTPAAPAGGGVDAPPAGAGAAPETQAPSGAAGAASSAAPAAATSGGGGAGGPGLGPFEPGSMMTVRLIAIDPDDGFDPAALLRGGGGRPAPTLVSGTVSGRSPAGELQVQTPLGLLTLNTKASLTPSTRIVFEVLGPVEPPGTPAAAVPGAPGPAPLALTREWAALSEALEVLARADPALAQTLVENVIPRPGPGLAASMLFLLSALRGGDVNGWLGGPAMRALERAGRRDLLARLGDDFAQMGRLTAEPGTGEWRTWLVPIHDGEAIQLVHLFVKRRRGRAPEDDEHGGGTRFLVELDLSRLGPMQLDGLVRQKRFDLIVRSHAPLPRHMRKDIFTIFADALAATSYAGGVTFQATPTFAVSPLRDLGARPVGLSV